MLIITDPIFLQHTVPSGHPERPQRLLELVQHWQNENTLAGLSQQRATAASPTQLARVHSESHIARLEALAPTQEFGYVDPDTVLSAGSLGAARHAAGAMASAVQALLDGVHKRVFCAVRPPGHHAERDNAMGFCLFNSIAVGAATALASKSIERLAILDFDVHHGNGTVDIFRNEPRVLVCSSFQHPFYPHRQVNVAGDHLVYTPLPAGTDGPTFRRAIERDWRPALAQHQPQLILVSAGFDAHARDPLASLELRSSDFRWVTEFIVDAAERFGQGRIASILEGGYDLQALCDSTSAHIEALKD
ncbi:MAG: histone deacetylase family protein [Pseudomonadales bacterium]